MSFTRLDAGDGARAGRRLPVLPLIGKFVSLVAWAAINVGLLFAEQLAELLAPVLLLAGAAWWAIPRGLDALKLEGPANDILLQVRGHVPLDAMVAGHELSASVLLNDGLLCIGVVAICRTLSNLLSRLLLERP